MAAAVALAIESGVTRLDFGGCSHATTAGRLALPTTVVCCVAVFRVPAWHVRVLSCAAFCCESWAESENEMPFGMLTAPAGAATASAATAVASTARIVLAVYSWSAAVHPRRP